MRDPQRRAGRLQARDRRGRCDIAQSARYRLAMDLNWLLMQKQIDQKQNIDCNLYEI